MATATIPLQPPALAGPPSRFRMNAEAVARFDAILGTVEGLRPRHRECLRIVWTYFRGNAEGYATHEDFARFSGWSQSWVDEVLPEALDAMRRAGLLFVRVFFKGVKGLASGYDMRLMRDALDRLQTIELEHEYETKGPAGNVTKRLTRHRAVSVEAFRPYARAVAEELRQNPETIKPPVVRERVRPALAAMASKAARAAGLRLVERVETEAATWGESPATEAAGLLAFIRGSREGIERAQTRILTLAEQDEAVRRLLDTADFLVLETKDLEVDKPQNAGSIDPCTFTDDALLALLESTFAEVIGRGLDAPPPSGPDEPFRSDSPGDGGSSSWVDCPPMMGPMMRSRSRSRSRSKTMP